MLLLNITYEARGVIGELGNAGPRYRRTIAAAWIVGVAAWCVTILLDVLDGIGTELLATLDMFG
jgi:hypothetical protein